MAHGQVSECLPAPGPVVFDLVHDYRRRLEWDTLLQAAYLEGGATAAGQGVTAVCVGRRSLGGLALRTVYVTFERPTLAAVKMVNAPAFFGLHPPRGNLGPRVADRLQVSLQGQAKGAVHHTL